jgi:energy-coupling factor transporter ATP-binding protein EcfA2
MTADYKILLDVPLTDNLALGFTDLADAFKDVIEKSDPQFAIGLFGGWGSGKTTLMEAIEGRLDKAKIATVWFSAWRYEKESHLIVPLLDVVREGLVKWLDENQTASEEVKKITKQVAATVGKAIASLLAGFTLKAGVPGGPEISYDVNKAITLADRFDEADIAARVRRAFIDFTGANGERRIVVFVDDLDRCLPEGALEVLESMKLFFDLPGFVFVVGLDRAVVELSIEHRYSEVLSGDRSLHEVITGANYIRKIFQVPYSLSPVSTDQIDDFIYSIYNTAQLPTAQWAEIQNEVQDHLRYLVDARGVNPREIKRYINSYTLVRKIKPYLEKDILLCLQTIAFRIDWQAIQLAIATFRGAFIDALRRHAAEPERGHLGNLSPELEAVPQSFLTYIEPNNPGNPLVSKMFEVNEYLYSGEATRSSDAGPIFIDLFRDIGQLVYSIQEVFDRKKSVSGIVEQSRSVTRQLQTSDRPGRAAMVVREINAMAELVERTAPGPLSLRETLTGELENAQGMDRENLSRQMEGVRNDIEKSRLAAVGHVRQAIKYLQELYLAGTI